MGRKREKGEGIALESLKMEKVRKKLLRQFKWMDGQTTEEAIHQKGIEIQTWISRHVDERIILREKSIALFDENQNAQELSEKISKIAEQLKP